MGVVSGEHKVGALGGEGVVELTIMGVGGGVNEVLFSLFSSEFDNLTVLELVSSSELPEN